MAGSSSWTWEQRDGLEQAASRKLKLRAPSRQPFRPVVTEGYDGLLVFEEVERGMGSEWEY